MSSFWRNPLAVAGVLYITLCMLAAIFCYLIAPDHTTYANSQVLELARSKPGTQAFILLKPEPSLQTDRSLFQRILFGAQQDYTPIALQDTQSIRLTADSVLYTTFAGAKEANSRQDFQKGQSFTHCEKGCFLRNFVQIRRFRLGTDGAGRDLWSRILVGSRVSLSVGLFAVLLSLIIGITLGSIGGYFGGWIDRVVMWLISVIWSFPTLLLAIALSFVLGKGFWQVFVAIGLSMWVEVARMVRGQILSVREMAYTEAAEAMGFSNARILFRHVLPNIISPIIVVAVANFGAAVLIESGLSFLGIGVEAQIPSWGKMIYEGYTYIVSDSGKWLAFYPGLALILLVVSINLVGIALRDALDVRETRA